MSATRYLAVVIPLLFCAAAQAAPTTASFDILIYGGTAGGVAAAVQARRMGKTVAIIEPGKHLGGLTSGGLGATDIGNKAAIGGISREFYQRVRNHYSDPSAWTRQRPEQYKSGRASEAAKEDAMWTFEPSVAEKILREMLAEAEVNVLYGERLARGAGVLPAERAVVVDGKRINAIQLESGKEIRGRRFI